MNFQALQTELDNLYDFCRKNQITSINIGCDPMKSKEILVELLTKTTSGGEALHVSESVQVSFIEAFRKLHPRKALK